jgi:hypothetical protein
LIWKNKKPTEEATGQFHRCPKYPKVKTIEVMRTVEPQDLKDMRELVGTLIARVDSLSNPKPEPVNGLEKRVARLESIIVEMRNEKKIEA